MSKKYMQLERMKRTCKCRFCGKPIKSGTKAVSWRGHSIGGSYVSLFLHAGCFVEMTNKIHNECDKEVAPAWFDGGKDA